MRKLVFFLFFPVLFFSQDNLVVEYGEIWGLTVKKAVLLNINRQNIYIEIANPKKQISAEQLFSQEFDTKDIGYLISKVGDSFFLNGLLPTVRNVLTEDKAPKIKWKILNETDNYLGYNCKKAEGFFRGRKVYAYFTSQIPSNAGPWKFYGLPGLILKAGDENGTYTFVATRVLLNTKLEITPKIQNYISVLKSKEIPFKEFIENENIFLRDMRSKIRSNVKNLIIMDEDYLRKDEKELQFEWEKEPLKY